MKTALAHLKGDPVLKKILRKSYKFTFGKSENLFVDIIENIIGQQLSSGPAETITNRFWGLFTEPLYPAPDVVLAVPDDKLRAVGMSWAKASDIKNLSREIVELRLDLDLVKTLDDNHVIVELTKVKGIGRWTAEMILIFHLNRPDVFSLGDLGLRTAVSKLYRVNRDDVAKIEAISLKWSPYRSLASRYLWKSLDEKAL